ncbi:MAG: hypothetical protein NTV24_02815 [Candidatus Woesebacteria bacterium]|nr:hypothetical protein [Candidatus Woesebacteria bacterium]
MKKLFIFFLILVSLFIIHPQKALAHCPLCVAGAGVGLTLSRWVGVDDSITGLWMGAFLGAMSFWIYSSLVRKIKKTNLVWLKPLIYVLVFASTIWSFYKFNLVLRMGRMFGLDKLTFGIIAGGTAFYLVDEINNLVIRIKGKTFFPYQRIIVGLGSIFLLSFLDYYIIGYYI